MSLLKPLAMARGNHGCVGHKGVMRIILSTDWVIIFLSTVVIRQKGGRHIGSLVSNPGKMHPPQGILGLLSNCNIVVDGETSLTQTDLSLAGPSLDKLTETLEGTVSIPRNLLHS